MAGVLQHLRSSTLAKRPNPASMVDGQVAINYASGSPGMFFKDSNGSLVKVGPVHVGSGAPNVSPASGGTAGNSLGEQWLDTSGGTYVFKIWDGAAWRSEAGEFVNTTGDTMTGALGIIAGSASTPGLFFSGDANSGLYSPGADQVAISTNGSASLTVGSAGAVTVNRGPLVLAGYSAEGGQLEISNPANNGTVYVLDATTATNARVFTVNNDTNLQIGQLGGTGGNVQFFTGASERMRLDSSGRLGLGVSSPATLLHISSATGSASPTPTELRVATTTNAGDWSTTDPWGRISFYSADTSGTGPKIHAAIDAIATDATKGASSLNFRTTQGDGTAPIRLTIDNGGRVGIGTTSPQATLNVAGQFRIDNNTTDPNDGSSYLFQQSGVGWNIASTNIAFTTGASGIRSEHARIDSSGRLLVGASSAYTVQGFNRSHYFNPISGDNNNQMVVSAFGTGTPGFFFARTRGSTPTTYTVVQDGDNLGILEFFGADGSSYANSGARITCQVDGTPGTNDMPGRLMFSTTADGATSPTERMRITSAGKVGIGTTSPGDALEVAGNICLSANSGSFRNIGATSASNTTVVLQAGSASGVGGNIELNRNESIIYDGSLHIFRNPFGSADYARIDSSGRLLVGTSSNTNVGSTVGALVQTRLASGSINFAAVRESGGAIIALGRANGNAAQVLSSGDEIGVIRWAGADGTDLESVSASIQVFVDGTPGTNDMPGRLVFSTTADGASSPTERMRILSNGTHQTFNSTGTSHEIRTALGAGTSDNFILGAYGASNVTGGGTASFVVRTNGNVENTNNSYTGISDIKLKENIVDANSQWNDLKALQVRNYNFKEGQTHTQIGLVAQEVELVSPGLVTESPDRDEDGNDLGTVTKSVNYSVLYMKAVKALQEAMERIETLEAKVAALEGA